MANGITAFLETQDVYFNSFGPRGLGKEDISVWVDLSNWIGLGGSSKSTYEILFYNNFCTILIMYVQTCVPLSAIDVEIKEVRLGPVFNGTSSSKYKNKRVS